LNTSVGRSSVDILKSGGYKLSALEVEREILTHPVVAEVAVVGRDDTTWGQIVVAIVRLHADTQTTTQQQLSLKDLQQYLSQRLAPYKIPRTSTLFGDPVFPHHFAGELNIVPAIPRNHLGEQSLVETADVSYATDRKGEQEDPAQGTCALSWLHSALTSYHVIPRHTTSSGTH
jgi:malonyl-CoA/methylmalonyl-CoA synthetase